MREWMVVCLYMLYVERVYKQWMDSTQLNQIYNKGYEESLHTFFVILLILAQQHKWCIKGMGVRVDYQEKCERNGVLITKSYCLDTFSEDWEMIQDTNRLSIFHPPKASCCDNQSAIFAPLCIHTSMFCIFSKLQPHGRILECWSEGAGMCCVGYRVAHCSGVSNWSPTSNILLPHYVGVFAHVLLCMQSYLFVCYIFQPILSEGIQEGRQKEGKKGCFQSWDLVERVKGSSKW